MKKSLFFSLFFTTFSLFAQEEVTHCPCENISSPWSAAATMVQLMQEDVSIAVLPNTQSNMDSYSEWQTITETIATPSHSYNDWGATPEIEAINTPSISLQEVAQTNTTNTTDFKEILAMDKEEDDELERQKSIATTQKRTVKNHRKRKILKQKGKLKKPKRLKKYRGGCPIF